VPKFPHEQEIYPHAQSVYGQHFMCTQVRHKQFSYFEREDKLPACAAVGFSVHSVHSDKHIVGDSTALQLGAASASQQLCLSVGKCVQMSRQDALQLLDVMLNVADVNVISNNITANANIQASALYSQVKTSPQKTVHSISVDDPGSGRHGLLSMSLPAVESVAHQLKSAKQTYRSLRQHSGIPDAQTMHERATVASAQESCASAVANATVLHLTAAEHPATLLVKPPALHVDIWDQIVAPEMGCSGLLVESWLHSTSRLSSTCCRERCTVDAAGVQFGGTRWAVMQDHAKWAACCDKVVLCFGDMNRVHSQRVRGGMALCIEAGSSPNSSLATQLYEYLLPSLRRRRTTCFWKHRAQCPCKYVQNAALAVADKIYTSNP
jgi:hypothetical protein